MDPRTVITLAAAVMLLGVLGLSNLHPPRGECLTAYNPTTLEYIDE